MVANSSGIEAAVPSAPAAGPFKAGKEPLVAKASGQNKVFNSPSMTFGDWRDDLVRDGYVVVKGAVPRERAERYADQMYTYLEEFAGGLGFKRDDPSTIKEANLPIINPKGMVRGYGIAHEDFTWAIRQEPGVVEAFQRAWDTKDLIVSFDAVNFAFPNRTDLEANTPWPHQDQDPEKAEFRGLQGIVNILPNGPKDGGLIACKGGHLLSEEFHRVFKNEPNPVGRWTTEWYGFTDAGMEWLKNKGCEWIKIEAGPGDLLLWDSRTPHYNLSPEGTTPRLCTYVCYMPVADATEEYLLRKKAAFDSLAETSHWPNALHVRDAARVKRNGEVCPFDTGKPRGPVELTDAGWKLTGIPYVRA